METTITLPEKQALMRAIMDNKKIYSDRIQQSSLLKRPAIGRSLSALISAENKLKQSFNLSVTTTKQRAPRLLIGAMIGFMIGQSVSFAPAPQLPELPESSIQHFAPMIEDSEDFEMTPEDHKRVIITEMDAQGVTNPNWRKYIMATAMYETGGFTWMTEVTEKDHEGYKGRGYVQITHKANYQKFTDILGIDLVCNPELATDPAIAAKILVHGMVHGTFTGHSLLDHTYLSGRIDETGARQIVNFDDPALVAEIYETL